MAENDTTNPMPACPKCGNGDKLIVMPGRAKSGHFFHCAGCGSGWEGMSGGPLTEMSAVPAPASPAYHLHLTGEPFKPMLVLGQGLPKERSGLPCHYFTKDVIRTGQFIHPQKGFRVDVNTDRLDRWAETFRKMSANGVEVHIPADHSDSAHDNLGYVVGMERQGDRLMAKCQFIGDDAAAKAARNNVSVGIDPDFRDGAGTAYGDAIVHVALTPTPVITGLGEFSKVQAASRAAAGDVLTLAADPNVKESPMSDRMLKCSDEHLNSLQTLVPGLKDVPDEQLLARVVQHLSATATADDEDAGGPDKVAKLSRQQIAEAAAGNRKAWRKDVDRLTADLTAARTQVQDLSAKVIKPLDPEAHAAIRESAETKLENAVARGGISPATRDRLHDLLLGTKDHPNTLALSRAANAKGDKALALAVLDVLSDNRPVETGERSGLQALARTVPGEGEKTSADQAQTMLLAAANRYAPAGAK